VSERQLDHLPNSCHLFPAASDIIIANVVELLLVLSVDGLSLSVKHGGGCDNTELLGFGGNDFELYGFEVAADDEEVALLDGSVGVLEVGDEVGLGEVATDTLDGVSEGQHVDLGKVGHLSGRFDLHHVAQSHTQVFADGFVHSNFTVLELVVDQGHHQGLFSLLALNENSVAFEYLQLCHLGLTQLH
jgi:hypothetical protein